eukprot:12346857-Karenia_brevis.AAC.1
MLLGPAVGVDKDWSIKFSGPAGPAARRAKKAMQILRNEDGTWHKYQADSPCGDKVDIFIANDKSPKQRRVETTTKRLGRVFETLHPDLKVFVNRKKGTVSHQW